MFISIFLFDKDFRISTRILIEKYLQSKFTIISEFNRRSHIKSQLLWIAHCNEVIHSLKKNLEQKHFQDSTNDGLTLKMQ